jgi:hypothetical protein
MIFRNVFFLWVLTVGLSLALSSHATRTSPLDLEVFSLQADGTPGPSQFYSYSDLATLPNVTVKVASDPFLNKPATFTGVYLADVYKAIGAVPTKNILGLCCYDRYKDYFDSAYNNQHHPVLVLKWDGKEPDSWPTTADGSPLGPYCVVYENFVRVVTADKYSEAPRIPYGVVSIEISTYDQSIGKIAPPAGAPPAELNGFKIAMGCCIQCHNQDSTGGSKGHAQWAVLEGFAEQDFFASFVRDPKTLKPDIDMPAYALDAQSMSDLRAYFHALKLSSGN